MNDLIPLSAVTIHDVELPVIEVNGQRVITLAMVDTVHHRPEGTAKRNFQTHRQRFIDKEDFFQASSDEIRTNNPNAIPAALRRNDVVLLTESGYLMLVKSFTDDLAWEVQRKLVASYFRAKAAPSTGINVRDPAQLAQIAIQLIEVNRELEQRASRAEGHVVLLEHKVEEQKPKVLFHDAVAEAINCQTVQEAAKVLGTGQNRLFKFLRDIKLLMEDNQPYQRFIDSGHFRLIEKKRYDKTGEVYTYTQTLVTGKGLTYIQRKLAGLDGQGDLL